MIPAEPRPVLQRDGEPSWRAGPKVKDKLIKLYTLHLNQRKVDAFVAAVGASLGDALAPSMGRDLIMCILVMG